MVTISVSVVDAEPSMGLLRFAHGSHTTSWSGWDLSDDRVSAAFKTRAAPHLAAGNDQGDIGVRVRLVLVRAEAVRE